LFHIFDFQAKLQDKKRKLRHIKNIVESTENIPGHFSRRIVKRTLSDESLNKIEPVVDNCKPSDSKQNEVTKIFLKKSVPTVILTHRTL